MMIAQTHLDDEFGARPHALFDLAFAAQLLPIIERAEEGERTSVPSGRKIERPSTFIPTREAIFKKTVSIASAR